MKKKKPQFRKTVFSNGLTLLTERHPEYRSLSVGAWVKAGTRHERSSEAGLSHFLEHMLFKGTVNRNALELVRAIDQVGGEFNAFTTREYTCFHILVLARDMGLSLDILSDIILNSTFDAEELERERKVILQEIAMVEEAPEELVHDFYFEMIYGRHGLGRNILGSETSIRRFKRADGLRFFRKFYQPENLIISVVGDVSHEQVKRELKPLLKRQWPERNAKSDLVLEPAPKLKSGTGWIVRPTEQVHLVWGVEGIRYNAPDRFAAYLLNVYLGGGMSSELFQEIREKNALAYTVYSCISQFIDSGVFTVYAATSMNRVPLCLKLIEETVSKLCETLLSEAELKTIKENLKGTILLSADSVESRMQSIAQNEIFLGQYIGLEEVCRLIDGVSPVDLRRLARKLMKGERTILALGPKPPRAVREKMGAEILKKYSKR